MIQINQVVKQQRELKSNKATDSQKLLVFIEAATSTLANFSEFRDPEDAQVYIETTSLALKRLRENHGHRQEFDRAHRKLIVRLLTLQQYTLCERECWSLFCSMKLRYDNVNVSGSVDHDRIIEGLNKSEAATEFLEFMLLYLQTVYVSMKHQHCVLHFRDILRLLSTESRFLQCAAQAQIPKINTMLFKLLLQLNKALENQALINCLIYAKSLQIMLVLKADQDLLSKTISGTSQSIKNSTKMDAKKTYTTIRSDFHRILETYGHNPGLEEIFEALATLKTNLNADDKYSWSDVPTQNDTKMTQSFATQFLSETLQKGASLADLKVLDKITLFVDTKLRQNETLFVLEALSGLSQLYFRLDQPKRMRNISNLYYNMALRHLKNLTNDKELVQKCVLESFGIEKAILKMAYNVENLKLFEFKAKKILSILITTKLYESGLNLVVEAIKQIKPLSTFSDTFYFFDQVFESFFGLFFKCFINLYREHQDIIIPLENMEQCTHLILYLHTMEFLNQLVHNHEEKSKLAQLVFEKLAVRTNPILYNFCLCELLNCNGVQVSDDLELCETKGAHEEISCIDEFEELVSVSLSLRTLIRFSKDFQNAQLFIDTVDIFVKWIKNNSTLINQSENTYFKEYETNLLVQLVGFYNYHGQVVYSEFAISTFMEHRNTPDKVARLAIDSSINLAMSELLLNRLAKFEKSIGHDAQFESVIYELNYDLLNGNFEKAKSLVQTFLASVTEKPNMDEFTKREFNDLKLMYQFAQFSNATGKLKFNLGNILGALYDIRRSIRLLLIIKKKNCEELLMYNVFQLLITNYQILVNVSVHYGHFKDGEYYVKELLKLGEAGWFPLVELKKYIAVSNFYIISGEKEKSNEFVEKMMKLFESLPSNFIDKDSEIRYNAIMILFYSKVGDSVKKVRLYYEKLVQQLRYLKSGSDALFSRVYSNLSDQDMQRYYGILLNCENTIFSKIDFVSVEKKKFALSRPSEYEFETLATEMLNSKEHLIEAIKYLLHDPVFATLEDSAISIPSITVKVCANKQQQKNFNVSNPIEELKKSRASIEKYSDKLESGKFSIIELNEINYIYTYLVSILSAISPAVMDKKCMYNLLYFNEIPRYSGLKLEKQISRFQEDIRTVLPVLDESEENLKPGEVHDSEGLKNKIAQSLPETWNVITIDICPFTGDLMLGKISTNTKEEPMVVRLPLNRFSSRDLDEKVFLFSDAKVEFDEIIELNNESTRFANRNTIIEKEDKKNWWKERYRLNARLEKLLKDIEFYWIGGFKGIFNQIKVQKEKLESLRRVIVRSLRENLPSRQRRPKRRFGVAVDAGSSTDDIDIEDSVLELFLALDSKSLQQTELLEDLIYYLLDILTFHGEENAYDEIDIDQIYVDIETFLNKSKVYDFEIVEHTVLVIGKSCQNLPWESLPCLRECSVSRMPSIEMLLNCLQQNHNLQLSRNTGYYMLNPGKDLVRTQECFETKFDDNLPQWGSKVNEAPTEEEFLHALQNEKLFIYIGHGGGEQYFHKSKLKKLDKCCPTLLLGCSSGSLRNHGELETESVVYNYLMANCPMILANLWDVTDKDIDKFSINLFENWGLFNDGRVTMGISISEAVSMSRDVCLLKYLNGAAPVVYGLPFRIV